VYIVANYLVRNLISSSLDDFINDYKAPFGVVVESYFLFTSIFKAPWEILLLPDQVSKPR
jgi:hypothetical protein